jgi:hypothetical protein
VDGTIRPESGRGREKEIAMSDARALMRKAKEEKMKALAARKGGGGGAVATKSSGKERLEVAIFLFSSH